MKRVTRIAGSGRIYGTVDPGLSDPRTGEQKCNEARLAGKGEYQSESAKRSTHTLKNLSCHAAKVPVPFEPLSKSDAHESRRTHQTDHETEFRDCIAIRCSSCLELAIRLYPLDSRATRARSVAGRMSSSGRACSFSKRRSIARDCLFSWWRNQLRAGSRWSQEWQTGDTLHALAQRQR